MNSLFVFGAGASYGSELAGMPPIGACLFDELAAFNRTGWGALGPALATVFRENFERGMQELSQHRAVDVAPLQRAMAAYFFQFCPTTASLYLRLGRAMCARHWNGTLVTLNYDQLLQRALGTCGIQLSIGPVQRADQIEFNVPHGSCTLFCEGARGLGENVRFHGNRVSINGRVIVIDQQPDFDRRIAGDAFPPVMSYFEPKKQTTSGADFIAWQRERFAELVAGAVRVVVIGVHPRESDGHIWVPLTTTPASITYCSGVDGAAAYTTWCHAAGREINRDTILQGFWADHFEQTLVGGGMALS